MLYIGILGEMINNNSNWKKYVYGSEKFIFRAKD